MTNTLKTIIFFGTDEFSATSLRELIDKGFSVAAVVTKPDSRKGRGKALTAPLVKQIALQHDIAVLQPTKVAEIIEPITELTDRLGHTPIGVLVSYGKIIPQSVIDLFEPGIINVHPSLLPKYRGPSPIEAPILNGDTETGVTIMQLSAAMDAGPIYKQVTVPLDDTETAPELETSLAELGAQQLTLSLPAIMNGSLAAAEQDDTMATYCHLLKKEDGQLDPSRYSAEQAERRIRAHLSFPKTKVDLLGQPAIITKAHIGPSHDATDATINSTKTLSLTCQDGRTLVIDELIGPSGKPMSAQAFINGYGKK